MASEKFLTRDHETSRRWAEEREGLIGHLPEPPLPEMDADGLP